MVYADIFSSHKNTVHEFFIVTSLEFASKQSQDSDDD